MGTQCSVALGAACGQLEPHWVCPIPQHLVLGLGTLQLRHVLCLGHKGPHDAHSMDVVLCLGRPEEAFPFLDCSEKSMVRWPHGVVWRHDTQSLIPLSGLFCCSVKDSWVMSLST